MSPDIDPQPTDKTPEETGTEERRGFLTKSALLLAVLGLAGLDETAEAQPRVTRGKITRAQTTELQAVIKEAASTGNIGSAIEKRGASLPAGIKESLRSLTPEDLKAISSLRAKLGRLENQLEDNNGVVIM